MPSMDDLDSARQDLQRRKQSPDLHSRKLDLDDLYVIVDELSSKQRLPPSSKGELERIREEQRKFERWVIGILVAGLFVLIFMAVGLVVEAWRFNATWYKDFKLAKTQRDIIDSTKEQNAIITTIQSLEKRIEELKLHIAVTRAITDVTNGQKLLTSSVEDLEEGLKELKTFLYRNEKSTINIVSNQKILINLVQNLEKELRELRALYQNEKIKLLK